MKRALIVAAALAAGFTENLCARQSDEPIEEIVVTADLRGETPLWEMPASVTVLDAELLKSAGHQHFQDVLDLVPNLNWSSATSRPRFFQIRGIGERSQYEGAPNPSVGFLVDDIDFSGIGVVASLFDTAQVEVLRGPQGTRYGANALAGLVYVRTRGPGETPEYALETTVADDDTFGIGFSAGGPLGDTSGYRLALQHYSGNGFRNNDYLNSDDTNGRSESTARLKLAFEPTARLRLDVTTLLVDVDNGFDAFAPENTFTVHSDKPGRDAQQSAAASLRATWSGSQLAEVVSITTAAESDIVYSFDGDWGNDEYWGEFSPYDFTSATDRGRRTFSQELRWVSTPDSKILQGTTDWLAGVYLLDLEEDNRFLDLFNGDTFRSLDSRYSALNLAAFGQLDYPLDEQSTLSFGLRAERRDADYRDTGGLELDPSDTMLGGQLSLLRQFDPDRTGYLTLSRGYKAGGFNLGLTVPENRRQYEPEYLWNLEAGLKGRFAQGRLETAVSIFYARRDEMQVQSSFQIDPADPLTFVFFTDNAAAGSNYGLEADWRLAISDRWTAFGSLGLLDTEFKDLQTPERRLDGRDQAHAPNYQFHLGTEYRWGRWVAQAEINGRDSFFFSDGHDQRSRAYHLVNLRLGYETPDWQVYAWARNLANEDYATRGFFFALEPPDFPDREYVQKGDPRHVGITARFQFGG